MSVGDLDECFTNAFLRWLETFSFLDQFIDEDQGQITLEGIEDCVAITRVLQDA